MSIVSFVSSRKDNAPTSESMTFAEFRQLEKFRNPKKVDMSIDEYHNLQREQQSMLKDAGGYIAGLCVGGRKKIHIKSRSMITLDFDHIGDNEIDFLAKVKELDVSCVLHSTLKSTASDPRYRVVVELDESIEDDNPEVIELKYNAVSRFVASKVGIEYVDSTTFDVNRLMFFPAVCNDSNYVFEIFEGNAVCVEKVLSHYRDWANEKEWPRKKDDVRPKRAKGVSELGDPRTFIGWRGAFCKVYDIDEAVEDFLTEVYEPEGGNRYTFKRGSSSKGARVYDDSTYIYSTHDSDPINDGSCKCAYDMVMIHLFENDESSMIELCKSLPTVVDAYESDPNNITVSDFEEENGNVALDDFECFGVDGEGEVESELEGQYVWDDVKDGVIAFMYTVSRGKINTFCKELENGGKGRREKMEISRMVDLIQRVCDVNVVLTEENEVFRERALKSMFNSKTLTVEPRKHIVDGLIVENRTSLISAARGTAKTTFIGELVRGAILGGKFYGGIFEFSRKTIPLVVLSEGEAQDIKEKTDNFDEDLHYDILETKRLSPEEVVRIVLQIAKERGTELVIFDSFGVLLNKMPGSDSNSNDIALKAMDLICQRLNDAGIAVLLTMHMSNKSGAQTTRGASAIEDLVVHVYYLTPVKGEDGKKIGVKISHDKARIGEQREDRFASIAANGIIYENKAIGKTEKKAESKENVEEAEDRLLFIVELLKSKSPDGVCFLDDAAERFGVASGTLDNKLRTTFKRVRKVGRGRGATLEKITLPNGD